MRRETHYLNEKQVSEMTGRALSTLRNERSRRVGIPYYKIGRSVRYRLLDVIEFMESHRISIDPMDVDGSGGNWPRSEKAQQLRFYSVTENGREA